MISSSYPPDPLCGCSLLTTDWTAASAGKNGYVDSGEYLPQSAEGAAKSGIRTRMNHYFLRQKNAAAVASSKQ